jgi:VWFA-related protein
LTSGFSEFDEATSFRYDHAVYRLADFTNNPFAIEESFKEIAAIADTRPDAPSDLLGEKGPGWLRSILNVLGSGGDGGKPASTPGMPPPSPRANPRPSNRLMNDAVHDAALALQSRPANRRRIIVIISDGKDIGSTHTLAANTDLLLNNDIQVYAVSMSFATFGSFGLLSDYARATGGDAYPGTSTTSLEAAFAQITEQARNQYVLGYLSNNTAGVSEVFRKIEVRMRSPKHKAAYRKGYLQYPAR